MSDEFDLDRERTRRRPTMRRGNGNNGGNGDKLVDHRLTELERRMAALETGVKTINDTVIEINTKMDGLASKSYVLTIFGMTGGLAVLTFIGHLLLRSIGSGS